MSKVMSNTDFVNIAKNIATNYKTLYIKGCFGSPMNSTNKNRYCNNNSYNKQSVRATKIRNASSDTFGFDCVCLIKGILWGWSGNTNKTYGGATYKANGVPDVGADGIMNYCTDVSTDFSKIELGEILHMSGHVGIYIGDGLAVECTPVWDDGVQITAVGNIGKKSGYSTRTWTNHGRSNYIDYTAQTSVTSSTSSFFPARGYFKRGDTHENIGKIAKFMRKTFPAYTSEKALGNYFGQYIEKSIKEFQKRAKADGKYNSTVDGCIGKITLESLKKYGFKE